MASKFFLDGKVELHNSVSTHINANIKGNYGNGYEAIWGSKNAITEHACYASLNRYVRDKKEKYIYHTLGAIDKDIFDYRELLKRLNRMFKNILTIRYQKTKHKKIWVVKATEKRGKKIPIIALDIAYMQLFTLIRAMNSEYYLRRENIDKRRIPINKVWQLVEVFHTDMNPSIGHGINDRLYKIRTTDTKIFRAACKSWSKTIRDAFGRKLDWNDPEVIKYCKANTPDSYRFRQTPQFDFLEDLVGRFS